MIKESNITKNRHGNPRLINAVLVEVHILSLLTRSHACYSMDWIQDGMKWTKDFRGQGLLPFFHFFVYKETISFSPFYIRGSFAYLRSNAVLSPAKSLFSFYSSFVTAAIPSMAKSAKNWQRNETTCSVAKANIQKLHSVHSPNSTRIKIQRSSNFCKSFGSKLHLALIFQTPARNHVRVTPYSTTILAG